jgi:hypothetical protein
MIILNVLKIDCVMTIRLQLDVDHISKWGEVQTGPNASGWDKVLAQFSFTNITGW